ncbi:hypothetical protein EOPP23_14420 [Endozoicomonas sp. OPT23]|uniref:CsiV family protein n=1 Tax=Endozoicomonas sp. OPT23 TaxID=2072845 RepID=UPI00129A132E|nr:CsiV family protein [Endozoicomonas sp. OPT23]MRI34185.1 hypothetical protein [Endozoicomonas sp. OPT23]
MKKRLPFLLIGVLSSLQATAQVNNANGIEEKKEQWYQADLVVFLNKTSMTGTEQWPEITHKLLPGNIIELKSAEAVTKNEPDLDWLNTATDTESVEIQQSPDITRDAYVELPYEKQLLQKQGNILDRAKGYRVLKRQSWLLSIREGEETPAVVIRQTETESEQPFQLEGTVTVSSGRYLHADLDLWYRELAAEGLNSHYQKPEVELFESVEFEASDGDEKPVQEAEITIKKPDHPVIGKDQLIYSDIGKPMKVTRNFPLQQSRKIQRSEQTQYLDTPVIGVIFKLTPYEHPENKSLLELKPEDQASN